jgi:hypothetical protein
MTQYLITFPSDAMNHIPDEEMPEVGRAAHAVCQELIDAGVYLLTGDLEEEPANLVGTDGTVTDGPRPDFIGGITIVDVPSREDALKWAAKIARTSCVPLYAGSTGDRVRPRTRGDARQGCCRRRPPENA